MNPLQMRLVLLAPICLMGGMLWALPTLIKRGLLFAVPVPDGFRDRAEARQAIREYRLVVGSAIVIALALVSCAWPGRGIEVLLGPFLIVSTAAAMHYREFRKLAPYAIQPRGNPAAELSPDADRLPNWTWAFLIPVLLLAAAAFYLNAHWSELPARWPVHWGIDGKPNRWNERTMRGVYGPLGAGVLMVLYITGTAIAMWFGSRRRAMRSAVLKILLATTMCIAAMFSAVGLLPVLKSPPGLVILPIVLLLPVIVWVSRAAQSRDEPTEPTPNECWHGGGIFYYNPEDAAVFVERRDGIGYTMNFGNTWTWISVAGPIVLFAGVFLLIR